MKYTEYKNKDGSVRLFIMQNTDQMKMNYNLFNSMYDLLWWSSDNEKVPNVFRFKNEYDELSFKMSNTLHEEYYLVDDWECLLEPLDIEKYIHEN